MIYGQEWKVIMKETEGFCGLCDIENRTIEINPNLKDEMLIQTYLHEVFHAIWNRTGLNQSAASMELQEMVVENISTWLTEEYDFN